MTGSNQSGGQALDVSQEECAVGKHQQVGDQDREELHFTATSQLILDGPLRAEMNCINQANTHVCMYVYVLGQWYTIPIEVWHSTVHINQTPKWAGCHYNTTLVINFTESAKSSHVGMHFYGKTLPQKPTKQATMHTRRHAQTTHISQHDAFTTYLPSLHLSNHTLPMMSSYMRWEWR